MPTEILAVNDTSGAPGWGLVGASGVIALALPNDADTTYMFATGLESGDFGIANTALTSETITSVTVRCRARVLAATDQIDIVMSDNAFANSVPSTPTINTAYTDYVGCTSATKPSGGAWTVAAVNALQVKITSPDIGTSRVTTLTVDVEYSAGGTSRLLPLLGVG